MTLITSISGIRGTIGGEPGKNLTPIDIAKFASGYGTWLIRQNQGEKTTVVIGRDARPSGPSVSSIVSATLQSLGIHVIDLGLSTTPTVEVAVPGLRAQGGIILTASHNPIQWNALKLLNGKGEFISGQEGKDILEIIEKNDYSFAPVEEIGSYTEDGSWIERHIEMVCKLELVDVKAIKNARISVAVDAVNSTGGIAIPALLEKLGVKTHKLYCEPNGQFPHNPEPLKEHLGDISKFVREHQCNMGIVVDPDVDRLAFVCEDGEMFGEEYTLVAVADYILPKTKGAAVSNLSSSRALRDVASRHGQPYFAAAVGEVNVVEKMKENGAVIGGEGNGGIIYPGLHYGRDALVGIALFLSHYAHAGKSMTALRKSYPEYYMAKNKLELNEGMDPDQVIDTMKERYSKEEISTIDGLKIDFADEWAHLRKSNTEPIVRIYTESKTPEGAKALGDRFVEEMKSLMLKN